MVFTLSLCTCQRYHMGSSRVWANVRQTLPIWLFDHRGTQIVSLSGDVGTVCMFRGRPRIRCVPGSMVYIVKLSPVYTVHTELTISLNDQKPLMSVRAQIIGTRYFNFGNGSSIFSSPLGTLGTVLFTSNYGVWFSYL